MNKPHPHWPTDEHGWREQLNTKPQYPKAVGNMDCRFVVVGAGFTGLSAAATLAELYPEEEIIVLEARSLAQGASGRNSGFAVAHSHFAGGYKPELHSEYLRVNRINQAGLDRLRKQVKQHGIDCDWHEQGFFHTAADTASCREAGHYQDLLKVLNIPHNVLDRNQTAKMLGTNWYQQSIHIPHGALIQPAKLVFGLASALPENVFLFERSPVLQLEPLKNGAILKTPKATIRTARVVLASNYEDVRVRTSAESSRIIGSTLSGSFTRQLSQEEQQELGTLKQWGSLSLHSGGATIRLTSDGRLKFRNTAEYRGGMLLTKKELLQRQSLHRQAFENRFPTLKHVPFEYAWSGVEGITRNGTNVFKKMNGQVFFAGGYNGSGVSRGTAMGIAIAHYAASNDHPLVSDALAAPKAQWIPPRPMLDIGALWTVSRRFRGVGKDR